MKRYFFNIVVALTTLSVVTLAASNLFAQGKKLNNTVSSKRAAENLIAGIKSENEGLKRSSIYFAGKYEVKETINTLIDLLEEEKNPANRVLIALALYKIGSAEGLEAIKELSLNDKDGYVKRMCKAISNAYSLELLQVSFSE
jgi:HEAT repeat protein